MNWAIPPASPSAVPLNILFTVHFATRPAILFASRPKFLFDIFFSIRLQTLHVIIGPVKYR